MNEVLKENNFKTKRKLFFFLKLRNNYYAFLLLFKKKLNHLFTLKNLPKWSIKKQGEEGKIVNKMCYFLKLIYIFFKYLLFLALISRDVRFFKNLTNLYLLHWNRLRQLRLYSSFFTLVRKAKTGTKKSFLH